MSGTGPPPLLCLGRHPMRPLLGPSLMSPCCVSGVVLPMSTSRGTRGTGGAWGPTWKSASLLATPLTTRGGSSTILSPRSLLSQSVLSLMSAISLASKGLPPPSFPPHFLNTHPCLPLQISSPPLFPSTFLLLMILVRGLSPLTMGICMIMGEMLMGLILHIPQFLLLICHHLLPREPGLMIMPCGSPLYQV